MKKLLLLPLLLLLTGCLFPKEGDRTPLGWCLWDIQNQSEKYEDLTYTYQEIAPTDYKKESDYGLNAYIITTYTDEYRTEWYCFVEYNNKTSKKFLPKEDIYCIDCDIVFEIEID